MSRYYNHVHASLLAFCADLITSSPELSDFQVFDFDSHASIPSFPKEKGLIGIAEYSLLNDDKTYTASLMFVISTPASDSDNVKLREAVGVLFEKLRPGTNLAAIRSNTGATLGTFTVMSPVEALSAARTEGRPFTGIAVSLGTTLLVQP